MQSVCCKLMDWIITITDLASGYNSMLATGDSNHPCASSTNQPQPPKLQILANGMADMQLSESNYYYPNLQQNTNFNTSQSPLKRQNQAFGSPRIQLEQQQRKRFLEQRQLYASDLDVAGTSNAPDASATEWRTSMWMQDHYGNFTLNPDLKVTLSISSDPF